MHAESAQASQMARLGIGMRNGEGLTWRCGWRLEKRTGDCSIPLDPDDPFGPRILLPDAPDPYEVIEGFGNLMTGAGVNNLFSGLCTAGLATPFSAANAQIVVGDSSTTAKPSDTDMGAAAGSTLNTGDVSAATNASPIVLTVPGWTTQPLVGQVIVVAGILGNTAANGTWEVQAATATTVTLLNSSGNGALSTSAGSTVKFINKYRQAATPTVNPTMGTTISGATNATPIVITTSAAHNLADGMIVQIASVGGNTAANGIFYAKVTGYSTTTFALYTDKAFSNAVVGNGAYTSGGTVTLLGGVQFVASFGPNNGNHVWNEWGVCTGGAATNKQAVAPPVLLNHAIASLGTKTLAGNSTWTLTAILSIN